MNPKRERVREAMFPPLEYVNQENTYSEEEEEEESSSSEEEEEMNEMEKLLHKWSWKSSKEMKEYLKSAFEEYPEPVYSEYWARNEGETCMHYAAFLGDVDAVKILFIEDKSNVNAVDGYDWTPLHMGAFHGHVDVVKVLIQNGADVNAVDCDKATALQLAASNKRIPCVLQLLCFGAEIDERTIEDDKTKLLRPIETKLKSLRNGNPIGTSLMSDEERRFMWNLACVLAIKHPAIAFGTYQRVRAFVTFNGIFMGSGYDLGKGSIWRRKR